MYLIYRCYFFNFHIISVVFRLLGKCVSSEYRSFSSSFVIVFANITTTITSITCTNGIMYMCTTPCISTDEEYTIRSNPASVNAFTNQSTFALVTVLPYLTLHKNSTMPDTLMTANRAILLGGSMSMILFTIDSISNAMALQTTKNRKPFGFTKDKPI